MKNLAKTIENTIGKDRYFTHPKLAERIVRWANVEPGANVGEFSAGGGSFVRAILGEVPGSRVTAVEIDRVFAHRLKKEAETTEAYAGRLKVFSQDFLTFKPRPEENAKKPFDLAIINPPYGSRKDGTVGLDAEHVAHALKFSNRVVALLVTGFEHGVKRARTLFDDAYVSRRVVLVRRPVFHGPEDKGESARRDHVVLEFKLKPLGPSINDPVKEVESSRWELDRNGEPVVLK